VARDDGDGEEKDDDDAGWNVCSWESPRVGFLSTAAIEVIVTNWSLV
jgi:hypothetical protein